MHLNGCGGGSGGSGGLAAAAQDDAGNILADWSEVDRHDLLPSGLALGGTGAVV